MGSAGVKRPEKWSRSVSLSQVWGISVRDPCVCKDDMLLRGLHMFTFWEFWLWVCVEVWFREVEERGKHQDENVTRCPGISTPPQQINLHPGNDGGGDAYMPSCVWACSDTWAHITCANPHWQSHSDYSKYSEVQRSLVKQLCNLHCSCVEVIHYFHTLRSLTFPSFFLSVTNATSARNL